MEYLRLDLRIYNCNFYMTILAESYSTIYSLWCSLKSFYGRNWNIRNCYAYCNCKFLMFWMCILYARNIQVITVISYTHTYPYIYMMLWFITYYYFTNGFNVMLRADCECVANLFILFLCCLNLYTWLWLELHTYLCTFLLNLMNVQGEKLGTIGEDL